MNFIDSYGNKIDISVIGYFSIPDLKKEYIMYGLVNANSDNDNGHVLLGEVVKDDEFIQILGILPEEKDLVVAYYNEISSQIGGED